MTNIDKNYSGFHPAKKSDMSLEILENYLENIIHTFQECIFWIKITNHSNEKHQFFKITSDMKFLINFSIDQSCKEHTGILVGYDMPKDPDVFEQFYEYNESKQISDFVLLELKYEYSKINPKIIDQLNTIIKNCNFSIKFSLYKDL